MKITAPESSDKYFKTTEHAVRHLYAGLDSCWYYYEQALEYWDISKIGQPLTPENKEGLKKYLGLAAKYFDLKFSEAMYAGGILQIAFMAIKLYSKNTLIPPSCASLVKPENTKAIPFCIGLECYGIPSGLLIYAGRNQFSHWGEEEPHKVTRNVFNALSTAFEDNMFADLAFELSNPTINVYANEILLTALRWKSYDTYLNEMMSMLARSTHNVGQSLNN